jgi:hypothetical protein
MHLYLMQNTSRCQLAGTCSFTQLWCGITLPLAAGDPRPAGGKFNQGVYSVKNLVKRVWYWLLGVVGNSNSPMKRQDAQIN